MSWQSGFQKCCHYVIVISDNVKTTCSCRLYDLYTSHRDTAYSVANRDVRMYKESPPNNVENKSNK